MKKKIINAFILIIVFIITMYFVFRGQDFHQILLYLSQADMRYWLLAGGFVLAYVFGEASIICYLLKEFGQKVKLQFCMVCSFIGVFFSLVTPGASGGQPVQLLYMNEKKVSVSIGSLILMLVTLAFKFVLVLLGAVVLIVRPAKIMAYLQPDLGWCYFGLFLNIIAVTVLFLLIFHPTMANHMVQKITRLSKRFMSGKRVKKIEDKIVYSMTQYQERVQHLKRQKHILVYVTLITIVQRACLFCVTYFVYRSFGLQEQSFVTIVILQGMISVAVDMLPLPGGMGMSEKVFLAIFTPILGKMTLAVLVVSRGLTYYTQLFVSSIITLFSYHKLSA